MTRGSSSTLRGSISGIRSAKAIRAPCRSSSHTSLPTVVYTSRLANVWNMSALWRDVNTAAFKDPSLCIQGSTGLNNPGSTAPPPPTPTGAVVKPSHVFEGVPDLDGDGPDPLSDANSGPKKNFTPKVCDPKKASSQCDVNTPCEAVEFRCGTKLVKNHLCVPRCNNHGGVCPNNKLSCGFKTTKELGEITFGISTTKVRQVANDPLRKGFCVPLVGTKEMCSAANGAKPVPTIKPTASSAAVPTTPASNEATDGGLTQAGSKGVTTEEEEEAPGGTTKNPWRMEGSTVVYESDLVGQIWF